MSCNIQTFEERLKIDDAARSKSKEDARLNELQDQNKYLEEKVQFLKLHQTRNEIEIKRLTKTNAELSSLRNDMQYQIYAMMRTVKSWYEFRQDIINEERLWEEKAAEKNKSIKLASPTFFTDK